MNTQAKSITFENVQKEYYLQEDRTFKDVIPSLILGKPITKKHTVFENVSFTINKGETVGIVGKNGAGKSTMLKLIAGVTFPTSGKVDIQGKVAPLIELSAGFHHELTGYENIFLNAAILGMHKAEIKEKINDIIAFSELDKFIHVPVKRYSSGMYMRLGFSVAVHTNADILLIDEVLAVGDIQFQKKCLDKLNEIKKNQHKTIVFVSHDEKAVSAFCERAILLSAGKIIDDDKPSKILEKYHHILDEERQ